MMGRFKKSVLTYRNLAFETCLCHVNQIIKTAILPKMGIIGVEKCYCFKSG